MRSSRTIVSADERSIDCLEINRIIPSHATALHHTRSVSPTDYATRSFIIASLFLLVLSSSRSNIGSIDKDAYELQISAKEYQFARDDKLIGVCTLPLRDVAAAGSINRTLYLLHHLHADDKGRTILRVLAQRQADEMAKEFVKLKSRCRDEPV